MGYSEKTRRGDGTWSMEFWEWIGADAEEWHLSVEQLETGMENLPWKCDGLRHWFLD